MKNRLEVLRGRELPVVVLKHRAWSYVARTYAGVVLAGIAVTLIRSFFFVAEPEIEVLLVQ